MRNSVALYSSTKLPKSTPSLSIQYLFQNVDVDLDLVDVSLYCSWGVQRFELSYSNCIINT